MYIGIDLGTSSVKAILIDTKSKNISYRTFNFKYSFPKDGFSEQNPEEWIEATFNCFQQINTKNQKNFQI